MKLIQWLVDLVGSGGSGCCPATSTTGMRTKMTVGKLRQIIQKLPPDMLLVIPGHPDGSEEVVVTKAAVVFGYFTTPSWQGNVYVLPEEPVKEKTKAEVFQVLLLKGEWE